MGSCFGVEIADIPEVLSEQQQKAVDAMRAMAKKENKPLDRFSDRCILGGYMVYQELKRIFEIKTMGIDGFTIVCEAVRRAMEREAG